MASSNVPQTEITKVIDESTKGTDACIDQASSNLNKLQIAGDTKCEPTKNYVWDSTVPHKEAVFMAIVDEMVSEGNCQLKNQQNSDLLIQTAKSKLKLKLEQIAQEHQVSGEIMLDLNAMFSSVFEAFREEAQALINKQFEGSSLSVTGGDIQASVTRFLLKALPILKRHNISSTTIRKVDITLALLIKKVFGESKTDSSKEMNEVVCLYLGGLLCDDYAEGTPMVFSKWKHVTDSTTSKKDVFLLALLDELVTEVNSQFQGPLKQKDFSVVQYMTDPGNFRGKIKEIARGLQVPEVVMKDMDTLISCVINIFNGEIIDLMEKCATTSEDNRFKVEVITSSFASFLNKAMPILFQHKISPQTVFKMDKKISALISQIFSLWEQVPPKNLSDIMIFYFSYVMVEKRYRK